MEGVLSHLGALAWHSGGGSREADMGEASGWEVVGTQLEAQHVWGIYPRVPQDGTWTAPSEVARPVRSRRTWQDYKLY